MLLQNIRKELVEYGKRLVDSELTSGTGGNLSYFDSETGYMAITPSGLDFYKTKEEDIVILALDGTVIEGNRTPSSEWVMHKRIYETRTDINAIIHGHTIYASVLACLREELPATHYMIAVAGETVRVADYASFGSKELAENAAKGMEDRNAVLLANHGIIGGSNNLRNAFNVIEEVEYCAKIYVIAKSIGNPIVLPEKEMKFMSEKFKSYGQPKE
ncbi:MAG: L-fuculose-phosphate aldolase [Enterococcus aquimarinus]|jgi:L-fuculose-phosphate aldolase